MSKSWEKDYINLKGYYRADDKYSELLKTHPKLGLKCPTCETSTTNFNGLVYKMSAGKYIGPNGVETECDCVLQNRIYFAYLCSGIEELYQRLDWDDFVGDKVAFDKVVSYLEKHKINVDEGISLLFMGEHGRGKTMLANLMAKELVKLGYSVYFQVFADILDDYVDTWSGGAEEKKQLENRIIDVDVLILDDLGKEKRNHPAVEYFDTMLRKRTNASKPTFFTTNLNTNSFTGRYPESIVSLLSEQVKPIETSGQDFRSKARQIKTDRVEKGWRRPIV